MELISIRDPECDIVSRSTAIQLTERCSRMKGEAALFLRFPLRLGLRYSAADADPWCRMTEPHGAGARDEDTQRSLAPPAHEPDRWELGGVHAGRATIPSLTRVPETPEERRRRIVFRTSVFAFVAACAIAAGIILLHMRHLAEVKEAVLAASADGREASIDRALSLLDEESDGAERLLSARLRGMAALELGRNEHDRVATLLEGLSEDDATDQEARVARIYLALVAGHPEKAAEEASTLVPRGAYGAEAARARALAAWSVGDVASAGPAAQAAYDQQPSARSVALLALVRARGGAEREALGFVAKNIAEHGEPALRIARARIVSERDPAASVADADAVLSAADATPVEKAWAHLLRGKALAAESRVRVAREALAQAEALAPRGDETFSLELIELLTTVSAIDDAERILRSLPEKFSADAGRKARLGAFVALERGELERAAALLAKATRGPATDLVRARYAQAAGEYDQAQVLYATAGEDPRFRREAYIRLATMELERDRPREALAAAEVVLRATPVDPDAVAIAAQAKVELGTAAEASAWIDAALAAHPEEGRLLAARARIEMALEKWDAALGTLQSALRKSPDDADLHAALGEVSHRKGKLAEARAAFEAALDRAPRHPAALVGRLTLAIDEEDAEAARAMLERIDSARIVSIDVDRARAQYHVLIGDGYMGIPELRKALVRRGPEDPVLWSALGMLHLQAEKPGMAASAFAKALSRDPDDPWAMVGQALGLIGTRRLKPAEKAIAETEIALRSKSGGPVAVQALLAVARGRLELALDKQVPARAWAKRALSLDPKSAEARLLLADVNEAAKKEAAVHLRASLAGRRTPPEARARLALTTEEGANVSDDERCALAIHYRDSAPQGRFAKDLAKLLGQCRN